MRANIYIRRENEEKWEKVADKSKWINALLANSGDTSGYGAVKDSPVGPMITVLSDELPPLETPFKQRVVENSQGFCKEGHAIPEGRSKCMGKGCKYS